TDLQLAILRVLCTRGESTVVDLQEALLPERRLAQTTVATLLGRLEKRGVIAHRVDGRQYVYRAKLTERAVRRSMIARLTQSLFGGSSAALISHLLTSKEIQAGDVDEVKRLV